MEIALNALPFNALSLDTLPLDTLPVLAACFVRCATFLFAIPPLRLVVPRTVLVTVAGAMALSLATAPGASSFHHTLWVITLVKEAVLGFSLALPAVITIERLMMAGRVVDTVRGAQAAEVLTGEERHSLLEQFASLLGALWFTLGGGYQHVYSVVSLSWRAQGATFFQTVFPLLFLSLVFELALGALGRLCGGVQLQSEVASLRALGGLLLGGAFLYLLVLRAVG